MIIYYYQKIVSFEIFKEVRNLKKPYTELKNGDIVLFYTDLGFGREIVMDGTVMSVQNERVRICFLEGYKSRTEDIPHGKVISVYDPEGEDMRIENYSGTGYYVE